MGIYQELINREKALAVVGLGYVGMPLAIEFAKKIRVIGFDKDTRKIESYRNRIDVTGEVGDESLNMTTAVFSSEEKVLDDSQG